MTPTCNTFDRPVAPHGTYRLRPIAALHAMLRARHQRNCLAALDDHLLRDIGLTRAEAEAEALRPIWDAPAHWLR